MTLELTVAALVILGYALGSYADERRSRRGYSRLRPLAAGKHERTRAPLPSAP